jgi:L-malate glycosyltransferase
MKICFLANAASIHTIRWVNSMSERGHEVYLVTINNYDSGKIHEKIHVKKLPIPAPFGYYLNAIQLRGFLKEIKPDIINAHYASGYGTLARLANSNPYLLSVWGSDVFDFPYESKFKYKLIKKNLKAADQIASTSNIMKKQTLSLIKPNQPIKVTPFGVDTVKFRPSKSIKSNKNTITIGTVKSMEDKYGIEFIIKGTAELIKILRENNQKDIISKIRLLLVGDGSKIEEYRNLVENLGLSDITTFTGKVDHNDVPKYLNNLDIYVAPSTLDSESFGVAIVEASACEVPVIVSNVGGLPEVVKNGETGYIVEKENSHHISEKLFELIMDEDKRRLFGKQGRHFVMGNYDWEKNVDIMENVYKSLIEKKNNLNSGKLNE